jgi:transcriptional regulator with XRE-family HTH domain
MSPLANRIAVFVGGELRTLRLRAGLSLRALAELSGSHRPVIGRTELARNVPKLETAVLLAELCGGSARDVGRAIDRALVDTYFQPPRVRRRIVSARAGRGGTMSVEEA